MLSRFARHAGGSACVSAKTEITVRDGVHLLAATSARRVRGYRAPTARVLLGRQRSTLSAATEACSLHLPDADMASGSERLRQMICASVGQR